MAISVKLDSDPLRFEVVLPQDDGTERVIQIDVEKDLQIRVDRINDQLCGQPAQETRWAALSETSAARIKELKNQKDTVYAQTSLRLRSELELKGQKVTEGLIDSLTKTDKAYQSVVTALEQMEYHANLLETVHQGYRSQAKMLEVLSNNLRAQGDAVLGRMSLVTPGAEGPTAVAKLPEMKSK